MAIKQLDYVAGRAAMEAGEERPVAPADSPSSVLLSTHLMQCGWDDAYEDWWMVLATTENDNATK